MKRIIVLMAVCLMLTACRIKMPWESHRDYPVTHDYACYFVNQKTKQHYWWSAPTKPTALSGARLLCHERSELEAKHCVLTKCVQI